MPCFGSHLFFRASGDQRIVLSGNVQWGRGDGTADFLRKYAGGIARFSGKKVREPEKNQNAESLSCTNIKTGK